MTNKSLTPVSPNEAFKPTAADKHTLSAVKRFVAWLNENGYHWFNADLGAYRDHLLHSSNLSKASAKKHLERIRKRYRALLHDNSLRDMLYSAAPDGPAADRFAFVQEALIRLSNNTQYSERVSIKAPVKLHHADSEFKRLTPDETDALLDSIPRDTLIGYRDAALIALAYACGLREAELVAVTINDMRQSFGGKPALRVPEGKGLIQRMIIYGAMSDYLTFVDEWLQMAGISSGRVFRALTPDGKNVSGVTYTASAFAKRLARYTDATPHDLRRSYARNLYLSGATVEFVRQQLGHKRPETTLLYIGALTE